MKFLVFIILAFSILTSHHQAYACSCEVTQDNRNEGCGPSRLIVQYDETSCVKGHFLRIPVGDEYGNTICNDENGYFTTGCGTNYEPIYNDRVAPIDDPSLQCGSKIEVENRVVQEDIPVSGTGLFLNYSSSRVNGNSKQYQYRLTVTRDLATGEQNPEPPTPTTVTYWEDGVSNQQTFPANQTAIFTHTTNLNQNSITGKTLTFNVNYEEAGGVPKSYIEKYTFGGYRPIYLGLGGLSLSSLHFYDTESQILYKGDGSLRNVKIKRVKINADSKVVLADSVDFTHYIVVAADKSEAYLFNSEGYHVETRSTVSGKVFKTINYDSNMKVTSLVDSFGNTLSITRPQANQVVMQSYGGKRTLLNLDADGRVLSVVNPNNETYTLSYYSGGLLSNFTNPAGLVSTFTYNTDGLLEQDSNDLNYSKTLNVISQNRQRTEIEVTSSEGLKINYETNYREYGGSSKKIKTHSNLSIDVLSLKDQTQVTYPDGLSRFVVRDEDPDFPQQTYNTSLLAVQTGGVTNSIDFTTSTSRNFYEDVLVLNSETLTRTFDLKTWTRTYDGASKTYTTTSPMGKTSETEINDYEQVVRTKYAGLLDKNYTYDTNGRLTQIQQGARTTTVNYNSEFEISSITNAEGKTMTFTYDDSGQITGINNQIVEFNHDGNGNISGVKPPGRSFYQQIYNGMNSLLEFIFPSNGGQTPKKVIYTYDNDQRLDLITRPNGEIIDYIYQNGTGYLTQITTPEGNYTRTYNTNTDQLKTIEAPSGARIWFGYTDDELRNVNTNYNGMVGANYKWHSKLKLAGQTLTIRPMMTKSTISYAYDDDELVKQVGDLKIKRFADTGFIQQLTLNGTYEYLGYTGDYGESLRRATRMSGALQFKETYLRDKLGRVKEKVESGVHLSSPVTYKYYYDYIGKLKQVDKDGQIFRKYLYDLNGNRTSLEENGVLVLTATYDDEDRLLTYGTKTYVHDDFGRRQSVTDSANAQTTSYIYNSLGALASVTQTEGGHTDTITYINDGLGRRIERRKNGVFTNRYIYNEGVRLEGETNADGTSLTHYVYGTRVNVPDYMIRDGVKYKFVTDNVGSVRMVINTDTKVITQRIDYDSFGVVVQDTNPGFQPFYFAGGLYDQDTKLLRFGARDYDPETGRWTAKDPIFFKGMNTNLYAYVGNDPVNFVDPTGLSARDVDKIKKILNEEVNNLVKQGRRRAGKGTISGTLNNLESLGAGISLMITGRSNGLNLYDGCQGQADYVRNRLNIEKFDDEWNFTEKNRPFPRHFWLEGVSGNPSDPKLILDPWKGTASEY